MTSRVKPNNYNYFSGGALACIILLLSGPILYYFYTPNLSFANRAYGQVGTVEVEDGRVKIGHGQVGTVDDERSEGSSSNADEARTPPKSTQDTKSEDSLPAQQAQPTTAPTTTAPTTTAPTTTPTENAKGEDNTSAQSTGPVRFTFVDSFWTDYTSLGGVIASTSSETTTAQPLPPAIKQEVAPGEGEAILAVVLRNRGFADATSISGSLDLPSGFRALVTPEHVDSDTALASYNGIVKAGQTFTLYFRVEITADSQVGREYTGELKIRYFKVDEQEDEDTRSTTLDIPFRLSGKVVLSTTAVMTSSNNSTLGTGSSLSQMVSVNPGIVNPLKIEITNNGSAIATGVIVNVLPSSAISSSNVQSGGDGSSNANNNNSAESTTSAPVQQPLSSSTPATMVIVGSPTFNIGLIDANERKEIVPTIFPADIAAGTLTTLNIQISYNDAYGNKRTQNQVLGVQISPESPQSGLNVLPTSSASLYRLPESLLPPLTHTSFGTSPSNNTMSGNDSSSSSSSSSTGTNSSSTSSTQPQSIQIAAGSVQDLSFAISNNNNAGVSIADAVVS